MGPCAIRPGAASTSAGVVIGRSDRTSGATRSRGYQTSAGGDLLDVAPVLFEERGQGQRLVGSFIAIDGVLAWSPARREVISRWGAGVLALGGYECWRIGLGTVTNGYTRKRCYPNSLTRYCFCSIF